MEAYPYTQNRWEDISEALICLFMKVLSTQILKKQVQQYLIYYAYLQIEVWEKFLLNMCKKSNCSSTGVYYLVSLLLFV